MDGSRLDIRAIALALLCLAAISFAAATLDTTTSSDTGFGLGGPGEGDQAGGDRTPVEEAPDNGDGGESIIDVNTGSGSPIDLCVTWLTRPLTQMLILLGLLGIFLLGRWYDDAAMGLGWAVIVGYPGFFLYMILTSCQGSRGLIDLSNQGRPSQEGGGILGGELATNSPTLVTNFMLVLVVVLLGVVAILVLTSDHDQTGVDESVAEEEADPEEEAVNVAAIGAAAGRAADRIERDGEFENEVFRAWAEMTEPLSVARPESSTPGEFAAAAVDAGMDRDDVEHLTRLFADVRYGGAEPTAERETAAVETLRRIEDAYADAGDSS